MEIKFVWHHELPIKVFIAEYLYSDSHCCSILFLTYNLVVSPPLVPCSLMTMNALIYFAWRVLKRCTCMWIGRMIGRLRHFFLLVCIWSHLSRQWHAIYRIDDTLICNYTSMLFCFFWLIWLKRCCYCSMEYYMQKTYYKTASLISNSCKAIALLAGQTTEVAMLAFEYGKNLVCEFFFLLWGGGLFYLF